MNWLKKFIQAKYQRKYYHTARKFLTPYNFSNGSSLKWSASDQRDLESQILGITWAPNGSVPQLISVFRQFLADWEMWKKQYDLGWKLLLGKKIIHAECVRSKF